jgi:hypothetical protein
MSNRNRFLLTLGLLAVAAFCVQSLAVAGEDATPAAPAAPTVAAPAEAAKPAETPKAPEAPATATPTPMHTLLYWVSKQVAPSLDCPCPAKAAGEEAWRAWFSGGADVPLATLRDRFVADGWTADRFVTFFKEKASKSSCDCAKGDCAKGDCAKGDCAKASGSASDGGCCKGTGERADGKPCCCKCKKKDSTETKAEPAATEIPAEKPAEKPAEATAK